MYFNSSKPDTIWLDETKLDHSNAFRKDSRPDRDNFQFNSLYKKDIADFYPLTKCKCLGLSKRQNITLYPEKKTRKNKKAISLRYFVPVTCPDFAIGSNEFVHVVESEDFMPLVHSNPLKNKDKISGNDVIADDSSIDNPETNPLQKNRYFFQRLAENPHDINTWLTFVKYQDELAMNKDDEKFSQAPKAIIEKKMSIIEKALLTNPLSTELIIKYMELASNIWPHDKLNGMWKDFLHRVSNRGILWRHYVLYLQSDMLSMKVSSVLEAYRSGFRILIGIYNGVIVSHPSEENAEDELLLMFLQVVIFLWLAGHTEKAVCMLQCMIEFNHFCPENLVNQDHNSKLASFESFFDTDSPRFGTVGACGWNDDLTVTKITPNFDSSPYTTSNVSDFDEELDNQKNKKSKEELWLILENIRSTNEFQPFCWDKEDCDDTERIILFDDISFSLFHLSSPELKHQLILAYLVLLGVPVSRRLLHHKVYQCFSLYHVIVEATTMFPCFCHNLLFNDYVMVDSILFDEKKRPRHQVITQVRTIISEYIGNIGTGKYMRQLSQLWFHFECSLFRFECEKSKEFEKKYWVGMKKFVKSLLKVEANRSCVNLWCMYAMYEWNIGNISDAKKIFYTALQMSHADRDDTIFKVAKIIRVLIDIHLDWKTLDVTGSTTAAVKSNILNVSLAFIDSNKILQSYEKELPNSISVLKVSNTLQHAFKSIKCPVNKSDFLCCYLVFVYFFDGLDSLIKVSEEVTKLFRNDGISVDLSDAMCYPLLLMKYLRNSVAFSAYKRLLGNCVEMYPGNQKYSILFNSLKRYGLGGYDARRFYERAMKTSADMRPWLYAIDYEEKQMQHTTLVNDGNVEVELEVLYAQTGVHNRIRSLYNKLLRNDIFKHCSTVWMRYLQFQLSYGSKKQAIDTLYMALKNCPGVKKLYLLACDKFTGKFEEMLNLMEEKEVRIKLIIEELDILLED